MKHSILRYACVAVLSTYSLLFLSACNFSSPLELIYYDRVKFSFDDKEAEDKIIYLCTKEKTPEETQQKAKKANEMYAAEMEKLVEKMSQEMMNELKQNSEEKDEDFSLMDGISMSMRLTKDTEKIIEKIEDKYQCILIDIVETKTQ